MSRVKSDCCGCGGYGCINCFKQFHIQSNRPLSGSAEAVQQVELLGGPPCYRLYLLTAINSTLGAGMQTITIGNRWVIPVPEGTTFTISGTDFPVPHVPMTIFFTSGFSAWTVITGEV